MAAARSSLETGMVALLEVSDQSADARTALEREAGTYARMAKLYYEWEGFPEPPLDEANFAEGYLRDHPRTVLRPYLELFLLCRYRSAFEAALYEIDHVPADMIPAGKRLEDVRARYAADQHLAADRYREVWDRLAATNDGVVRAVADELDGVAYLYVFVIAHPRR